MIAKRYDDELMYSVQRCDDSSNKYKYCTKDGKLAFKKPDKDFLGVTKQNYKNVYVINGEIYIADWFVKNFSVKGDTIVDPFLGTGTTAIASELNKRKYVGYEISKEYCQIAKKRIAVETSTLF